MINKLIPIYREKTLYMLFYDIKENKLYKFPYRQKSSMVYVGLFLVILYGANYLDNIYEPLKTSMLNIILFFVSIFVCYFIAKYLNKKTYIEKADRTFFFTQESMKKFAEEGLKQLKIELRLGVSLCLLMMGIGFVLFFLFSSLKLLIIGCLGTVPFFMIMLTKPLSRYKILKKFENEKISL